MFGEVLYGGTSCPVAMHDPFRGRAARVLGVRDNHQVAMVLTFGYPESGRRPPVWAKESMHRGIARTPLSELVHEERWRV